MARKRFGIEFEGFEQVTARLTKLGADMKGVTEKALRETHKIVTQKAEQGMSKSNLPAGGKYSTGKTERSLRLTPEIEWVGSVASVPVGFSIKNGGLPSIFLIYGTPKMKKDQALYNAFYSKNTRTEIMAAQEDIFYEELRRLDT